MRLILASAIGATLALAGCRVEVAPPPPPREVVVEPEYDDGTPAPPEVVEVAPARPYPDAFWIQGHWVHYRHHWVWRHGYWARRY